MVLRVVWFEMGVMLIALSRLHVITVHVLPVRK